MNTALAIGSVFGAIVGLVHAFYVYAHRARRTGRVIAVHAKAAYYALWTFALWVLFGSYVLYLGLLATAIYGLVHAVKWLPGLAGARRRWT